MATTRADPVFVDTNVLIYANVAAAPEHQAACARLEELANLGPISG
jgi:predicted nucleic acid-binding protein